MDKRGIIFLVGIFLLPFVSAEIFVSQLNEVYNIGDELTADLTLIPSLPSEDLLVNLDCGDFSSNIYNNYHPLGAGEQGFVTVQRRLSSSLLGNLTGSCSLLVNYGTEIQSTEFFEISNEIYMEVDFDFENYEPGSNVNLQVFAEKESGNPVEGYLELISEGLGVSIVEGISDGELSFSFEIPEDAKSGEQNISLVVYELGSLGEQTNSANLTEFISISSILTELKIIFSSDSVLPGEDFTYFVNTYDQAGDVMQRDISLIVYEPEGFVFLKKLVKPENEQTLNFALDSTQGYWKVEASSGGLSETKLFYLEEIEEIQTSLINNTLIVTNIGNVRYVGPLEISIGSSVEVKQVDLEIGESKKFNLYAPDGTYLIRTNNGNNDSFLGNVALTGNAVRISDSDRNILNIISSPGIWIIIVFSIVGIFGVVKGRRFLKFKKRVKSGKKNNESEIKTSSEVMDGKRERASIIILKLDKKSQSDEVSSSIKNSLKLAKDAGAKIYADGNYRIMLLSPTLTKKENNDLIAVKIAKKMEEILKEHNRKFKGHVFFGLGVGSGEIISEIGNEGFKFSSIGNVITGSKKIAEESEGYVLLSDQVRRKVIETVKTEKIEGKDLWKISRITEREKHKDFLRRFIERIK